MVGWIGAHNDVLSPFLQTFLHLTRTIQSYPCIILLALLSLFFVRKVVKSPNCAALQKRFFPLCDLNGTIKKCAEAAGCGQEGLDELTFLFFSSLEVYRVHDISGRVHYYVEGDPSR